MTTNKKKLPAHSPAASARSTRSTDEDVAKLRVLVIGGPPELSRQQRTPAMVLERIECDIAGILGHPRARAFYTYQAVIFWPNKSLFALPTNHEAWVELRKQAGGLPGLHPRMWDEPLVTEEISCNWKAQSGCVNVEEEPEDCHARRRIYEELGAMCETRLRREIVRGVRHQLLVLAVVPRMLAEIPRDAFKWLSSYITFSPGDPVSYGVDPRHRPVGDSAELVLQALTKALPDIAPYNVTLQRSLPDGDTEFLSDGDRHCWGRHWQEDYNADERSDPEDSCVQVSCPHRDGAGEAKSVLFMPVPDQRRFESLGFVVLAPEPRDVQALIEVVCGAKVSALPTQGSDCVGAPDISKTALQDQDKIQRRDDEEAKASAMLAAVPGPDSLVTLREAAAYMGHDEQTIRRWITSKPPLIAGAVKAQGKYIIPMASLLRLSPEMHGNAKPPKLRNSAAAS